MTRHWVTVLMIFSMTVGPVGCARYQPNWESLARKNEAPDWFRDAKFGIYFHWGVYSVPAFGSEWYPRNMYRVGSSVYKHHVETYGDPAVFGYEKFVPMFTAEKFNADEWAELFEKAGAKFAGPVAEHHDGFSMWASKRTPWNAADRGPKRDIVGELATAIRKHGMKFVTTFHHARNNLWEKSPGHWTGHYDGVKKNFPQLLKDPQRAILFGYMPRETFLKMWLGKLEEVIDHYRPDLMWFDAWLNEIPEQYRMRFLAYYFNKVDRPDHEVVVTFKQQDLPRTVALDDYEKGRAKDITPFVWLTDDTISYGSWCYTQDLKIKSTAVVLTTLIDIVSKNGQLLLNISPKADGTIPQVQKKVLLEMGQWLQANGEAIYGTRPWVVFGEGKTRLKRGGHFVGNLQYTPEDVRYTHKGKTVYAIFLGWPGAGKQMLLKTFGRDGKAADAKVKDVTLVCCGKSIPWKRDDAGLVITMPNKAPNTLAVAFRIETD